MYISRYSEKYRFNIIKGAIAKHKEMNKLKPEEIELLQEETKLSK
jgi:hypothetical protein